MLSAIHMWSGVTEEEKVTDVLVRAVLDLREVVNKLSRLRPSKKGAVPGIHHWLGEGSGSAPVGARACAVASREEAVFRAVFYEFL